jgi:hypothetical protein
MRALLSRLKRLRPRCRCAGGRGPVRAVVTYTEGEPRPSIPDVPPCPEYGRPGRVLVLKLVVVEAKP